MIFEMIGLFVKSRICLYKHNTWHGYGSNQKWNRQADYEQEKKESSITLEQMTDIEATTKCM